MAGSQGYNFKIDGKFWAGPLKRGNLVVFAILPSLFLDFPIFPIPNKFNRAHTFRMVK